MNTRSPEQYPRRMLLAVLGRTPQVMTETLYALAMKDPPFLPTQVHILTTEVGATRFLEHVGTYQRFFRDDYAGLFARQHLTLGDVTVHRNGAFDVDAHPARIETRVHVVTGAAGDAIDVRTPGENEQIGAFIMQAVLELTRRDDVALHASMAGGRKTMGFYLGYLMSMFGRDQDRLSHVLVDDLCENTADFFYPPPTPTRFLTRGGAEHHPTASSVMLAEIPFIRHRSGFADADLRKPGMSFSQAVTIAQRSVRGVSLIIDVTGRRVTAGGVSVPIKDNPLAWLLWFAERALSGGGGVIYTVSPKAFLACYARVLDENASLKWDATNDALKDQGYTHSDFRYRISSVNRALTAALGKTCASPYLIRAVGKKQAGHDRPYELSLPKTAITVLG